MRTYREILEILKNIPEDQLDDMVIICDGDDNYRAIDGHWRADGTEGRMGGRMEHGKGRRPVKGRVVFVLEEDLWGED